MRVLRIKPNILSDRLNESRAFYSGVLGLEEGEGLDWILFFGPSREARSARSKTIWCTRASNPTETAVSRMTTRRVGGSVPDFVIDLLSHDLGCRPIIGGKAHDEFTVAVLELGHKRYSYPLPGGKHAGTVCGHSYGSQMASDRLDRAIGRRRSCWRNHRRIGP